MQPAPYLNHSFTFHICSILPFSLAFNATSASVAQVLINCFCGIPLYSIVNLIKYNKLILKLATAVEVKRFATVNTAERALNFLVSFNRTASQPALTKAIDECFTVSYLNMQIM